MFVVPFLGSRPSQDHRQEEEPGGKPHSFASRDQFRVDGKIYSIYKLLSYIQVVDDS